MCSSKDQILAVCIQKEVNLPPSTGVANYAETVCLKSLTTLDQNSSEFPYYLEFLSRLRDEVLTSVA